MEKILNDRNFLNKDSQVKNELQRDLEKVKEFQPKKKFLVSIKKLIK